jgi:hypothetical protein
MPSGGAAFRLERVPPVAWALLTVAAAALRVEYAVGSFSFATAVALLAGSASGSRRGALSQTMALAAYVALLTVGMWSGGAIDLAYAVGAIPASALAGHLAPLRARAARPGAPVLLGVGVVVLGCGAAVALAPAASSSAITRNTFAVVALAVTITVYYGYRLISEPARIAAYVASLVPYYATGLIGTWLLVRSGTAPADVARVAGEPAGLLFRGLLNHLPGDLLGIVLITYLTSARRGSSRLLLR